MPTTNANSEGKVLKFIHLSDIHFGQAKDGGKIVEPKIRERLEQDCAQMSERLKQKADAIIITGDIAYSGQAKEYEEAVNWIEKLIACAGTAKTKVCVVPGNHDLDRKAIDLLESEQYEKIRSSRSHDEVEDSLTGLMTSRLDWTTKFSAYRDFAKKYGCDFRSKGEPFWFHDFELSDTHKLRMVGLSSSIVSASGEDFGKLVLGFRQYTALTRTNNVEYVALMHHPLHWFMDRNAAGMNLINACRVILFGHEHDPDVHLHTDGRDNECVFIKAGAVAPERGKEFAPYTYNWLEFKLAERGQNHTGTKVEINSELLLKVYPRYHPHPGTEFLPLHERLNLVGECKPWTILSRQFRFDGGVVDQTHSELVQKVEKGNDDDEPVTGPQAISKHPFSAFDLKGIGDYVTAHLSTLTAKDLNWCAWTWLRPETKVEDLDQIRTEADLKKLAKKGFIKSLISELRMLMLEESLLVLWISRRIAVLEYEFDASVHLPKELLHAQEQCRPLLKSVLAEYSEAMHDYKNQVEKSITSLDWVYGMTSQALSQIMFAAALVVKDVLGEGDASVSANLMVPVTRENREKATNPVSDGRSKKIWSKVESLAKEFLIVVAETRNARHAGFWIPIFSSKSGEPIFGAPNAYVRKEPSVILKADLPDFSEFTDIEADWKEYMEKYVPEQMFISLPMTTHADSPNGVSVLNVDIFSAVPWPRLYDPRWLTRAQQAVSPFVETATYLRMVKLSLEVASGVGFDVNGLTKSWYDDAMKFVEGGA